jgi:hypothetical protein
VEVYLRVKMAAGTLTRRTHVLTDTLIFEPLILSIPIHYPDPNSQADPQTQFAQTQFAQSSEGARIALALDAITNLPPDFPLFIYERAHGNIPTTASDNAKSGSGSFCVAKADGSRDGRIALKPMDPAKRNKRIRLSFKLYKGRGDQGWLTLGWNPTSMIAGDNVHPASVPNAQTGEIVRWPSSATDTLTPFFRLGFVALEGFFQQVTETKEPLFDPATWESIQEGAAHIVRTQLAGYLPAPDVPEFLKGLGVLYGQTIAAGKGITNLAMLQGLVYEKPYLEDGSGEVTSIMVIKRQGKKPSISTLFYNKDAVLRKMRQRKGLPELKAATVNKNVRLDMTFHSLGVVAVVRQARGRLKELVKEDPAIFKRYPELADFLNRKEGSTVWALERAIRILSLHRRDGKYFRRSFADWLVPYILQDVLRLDVVTGFTVKGYVAFLLLNDKVAVAWRNAKPSDIKVSDDPESEEKNWAMFLAEKAGVSLQTVYNRQKAWIARYGIDIALPNAFYYGALYYGPNSVATPKDQQATLAAHSERDGEKLLRLRDKAAKDFDRLRIDVVGATIRAPLHKMPVEVAEISPPSPALAAGVAAPELPMAVSAPAMARPAGIRLSAPQAAPAKQRTPAPLGAGAKPAPEPIKVASASSKSGIATVKLGVSSASGKKAISATHVPPKVGKGPLRRGFSLH